VISGGLHVPDGRESYLRQNPFIEIPALLPPAGSNRAAKVKAALLPSCYTVSQFVIPAKSRAIGRPPSKEIQSLDLRI